MANYDDIFKWIKNAEAQELLNNYEKYGLADAAPISKQWKRTGSNIHNIKTALNNYQNVAAQLGYGKTQVESNGNGTTIWFLPTDSSSAIDRDSCPSITIGKAKDGIVIENGMPAINNPIGVRGADGSFGISNALAIGIDEAADNLSKILHAQRDFRSYNTVELAQKIKRATNRGLNTAKQLNPKVWAPSASKAFKESVQIKNAMNAPIEYMIAKQRQMQMQYYSNALYKALESQNKLWGAGAPATQKQFESMVQRVYDSARGKKNFANLDKAIKDEMPWFYKNAWKGEIENVFKTLGAKNGLKLSQGGKREGAPAILSVGGDLDLPFGQLQITGRKLEQNLMHYIKDSRFLKGTSKAALGTSRLTTNSLNELYEGIFGKGWENKLKRDLYGYGQIEDKDLIAGVKKWAQTQLGFGKGVDVSEQDFNAAFGKAGKTTQDLIRKQFKIFASKGFGKDASISSYALSKDLEGLSQQNLLEETVDVTKAINNIAQNRVFKDLRKKGAVKTKEEFGAVAGQYAKEIAKEKDKLISGDSKYLIKKSISKVLGLDSKTKVFDYDISRETVDGNEIFSATAIKTIKKINSGTSVTRGGYLSDLRTNRTSTGSKIGDQILGFALINAGYDESEVYKKGDPAQGLAISFVEKKEKINEKNLRSQLNREIEYVLNKDSSTKGDSEVQKALQEVNKYPFLQGIFKFDSGTGLVSVDSSALEKSIKKSKKESPEGPLAIFNEITDLGRKLGFLGEDSGLKFEVDKKGEIVQTGRMIGATAVEVVSNDNYSGGGSETNSVARYGSHELLSLKGSVGEMRERGDEAAAAAMQQLVNTLQKKVDKQKIAYSKYTRSVQAIQQYGMRGDRNKVLEAAKHPKSNLALVSLSELAGLNLDLDQRSSSGGLLYNDEASNPVEYFNLVRELRYKELLDGVGGDKKELEKLGIFNSKDIQIGIDLGETIHGSKKGKDFFSSIAMLGYGTGEKSSRDSSWTLDPVMVENIRIAKAVREWGDTADKTGLPSSKLFNKLYEGYHNIDDIVQDAIYDKFDKVEMGKDSGYVLLSAMNNQAKELLENKTVFGNNTAPDMILSAITAKSMFNSEWKTEQGRQSLQEEYRRLFPNASTKDLNNRKKIIKEIINHYDINRDDYNGDFYNGLLFNRFPTIRFAGDSFGGNLAFASGKAFTDQGGLIINQDLAGLGKGDMDGDMIAFFNAAQYAGLNAEQTAAISSYFKKNADTARKIREGEEFKDSGKNTEISKILSLVDDKSIRQRLELINSSAKGAGIYGDEVYAVADILANHAVGQSNAAFDPVGSFLGNFALKTVASLYQEGINIKNAKGHASEAEINSMLRMSGQAKTWDDYGQMLGFLKKAEKAGIFKNKGAFRKEIIEQLNLPNLSDNDPKILKVKEIAKKHHITWDKSSNNIPTRLLAAILTDKELGTASLFKNGASLGELIENRYYDLAGHRNLLKYDQFKEGVISEEDLEKLGLSKDQASTFKQELNRVNIVKEVNKKGADIGDFHISATGNNGVSSILAPWFRGKENDNFAEYIKILDSDKELSEEDRGKIEKLSPDFRKGLRNSFATLVGGTVSHKYAEAGITKNKRERERLAKEADEYYKSRLKNAEVLGLSEEEFQEYAARGVDLQDLVNYTVGEKKGKVIGTELGISSFGKGEKDNQFVQRIGYMDYLYSHKDKNGRNVLSVGDFKTNAKGTPGIENVLQNLLYIESLKQLKQDILESGSFTVDDYIGSGRNFSEKWIKQFGEDDLRRIYDSVKTADKFEGELSIRDAQGLITKHSINADSVRSRELIERINNLQQDTTPLTEAEKQEIVGNSAVISKIGSFVGRDTDPWSLFGAEFESLRKLSKKYKELTLKKKELQVLKQINETELPGKQKDDAVFDEQEKLLDEELEEVQNKLTAEEETLLKNGKVVKLDGTESNLDKQDLDALVYAKSYTEQNLVEAKIDSMKTSAAKRQYKEATKEEKRQRQRKAELSAYQELSKGKNPQVKLDETEAREVQEELDSIDDYLKIILAARKAAAEIVKSTKGGKQFLGKYKQESDKYWEDREKESRINQSITIRNKNEYLFSTGQSAQQRVLDLQRQIEAYDKDLNKKGLSSTEKALIEKLRHKSTIELARRQEDLSLYDQLYGIDGTKYSDDYMQGKNSAIDSDFARKKQRELQEKANWENDAGFMGMDAPTIRWLQNIMTGGGVYTLLAKFKKGLNDIIQKAIQLDAAMTNLRIVTGESATETRSLIGDYSDLAKQLGVTTIEVASGASEWLRQGYEVAEVNDLITASTYLSKLGMIDSATATKDLTSALKGFKLEASDAMDIVDKLTALDVEAATTAGDIAEGLAQFANLATLNGVDIDQASAYVATIADITQQSGNSVGNAMKTIMSRYGNVKASAYDTINLNNATDTSSDDLNDVEKILTKLGISMRDTNLEFKDFDEILDEIAGKWSTLDTVSKRAIANAFAGTRQQEAFLSLLENYDTYQDFVKTSQNSEGTAETKYQSYQESYEATKNSFTAAIEDLANNSAIIHTLEDLTKAGQWLVERIDKVAKYLPMLITQFNSIRGLWGRGVVQRGAEVFSKVWKGKSPDAGIQAGIERTWGFKFRSSAQKLADARKGVSEYESARKGVEEYEKTLADVEGDRSLFTKEENEAYEKNLKYLEENAEAYKKNQKIVEKSNSAQIKQTEAINTNTTATKQDSVAENVETQENVKAAASEKAETAANQQAAGSSGSNTGGFNKTGAILAGLNMAASGITNAVTSYATQATTHKNSKGEEVESSEEAQKVGASVSAVINSASGIPIIGGIVSFAATKVGEKIAASIDKERDEANILAEEASNKLSALSGIESDLETIGEDVSSIASQEAVSELMNTLYSKDGEEARKELAKYLGGESALYTTLIEIKNGNEESFKKLQAAQLEAKKAQVVNQYASQMYKNNEAVNDAYNDWQGYSGYTPGVIEKSIEVGTRGLEGSIATGTLVGVAGAGLGSLAGALGASALAGLIPVAGWIVGAGIALTGVATSIRAAVKYAEVKAEEERAANAAESEFLSKSTSEKITQLNSELLKAQAASDSEAVGKINTLISALETQNALVAKIQDEINDITFEQGLLYASTGTGSEKQYLSDMTTAQLKNLGIDEILTIFAQGLEQAGGLIGEYVWADDAKTQLSDAGYDLLKKKLYNLDDEEINSVLSGSSRTLSEVLSMKDETKEKNALLSNFATALGVPKSDLESLRDLFGSITYAEAIMSTSDLSDRIDGYDSLINSITNGAGNVSGWMQTIISDYPELIAYMGDTPTLFTKITEKLKALNQVYLSSAFSEVLQNTGTYDETKASFYEVLNDDSIKATLDAYGGSTGVTSYADIWSYIQTQIQEDESLTEAGQKVYDALKDTFKAYGISVTADKLSSQFKSVISYQNSLLDDQINNLTEQKEALQNINSQREYENKLIEAKLKLENASKEKKRVYRAGVGWVYEADQASIKEAQENLESVKTEKTISSLDSQITELQAQKEELNNIYTEINNANLKANFEALLAAEDGNASSMDTLIDWIKKGVAGVTKTGADAAEDEMKTAIENKQNAWTAMQKAWDNLQDILQDTDATDTGKYNTALQNYISKATAAKSAGVTDAQMSTLGGTTILGKNMSAADVLAKGYENLKSTKRIALTLEDSSGSYTGSVGFEAFSSDKAMKNIFSQLMKGKGTIWNGNKKVVWENGDAGYQYGLSSDMTSLEDYIAALKGRGNIDTSEFVFSNGESGSGNEAVYYSNGAFYKVQSTNSSDGKMYEGLAKAAMGSLGLRGGLSLINELGTEAIITPSGTVTALPSATGVVPADITRNLWELGEVAPALLKTMQATITPDTIGDSILSSLMSDESTNINTINMNVNADSTFDANKFINSVKSRVALTRNSSK